MLSHPSSCCLFGLEETGFFQDAFALLTLIIPFALWLTLWRMFVTNESGPRGDILVLGLDDSSPVYSDLSPWGTPLHQRLFYIAISAFTCTLGVLTSEVSKSLKRLISIWFLRLYKNMSDLETTNSLNFALTIGPVLYVLQRIGM